MKKCLVAFLSVLLLAVSSMRGMEITKKAKIEGSQELSDQLPDLVSVDLPDLVSVDSSATNGKDEIKEGKLEVEQSPDSGILSLPNEILVDIFSRVLRSQTTTQLLRDILNLRLVCTRFCDVSGLPKEVHITQVNDGKKDELVNYLKNLVEICAGDKKAYDRNATILDAIISSPLGNHNGILLDLFAIAKKAGLDLLAQNLYDKINSTPTKEATGCPSAPKKSARINPVNLDRTQGRRLFGFGGSDDEFTYPQTIMVGGELFHSVRREPVNHLFIVDRNMPLLPLPSFPQQPVQGNERELMQPNEPNEDDSGGLSGSDSLPIHLVSDDESSTQEDIPSDETPDHISK